MKLESYWKSMVNRRVLVQFMKTFGTSGVTEVRVLDVSPSHEHVKLEAVDGSISWVTPDDLILVETLGIIECPVCHVRLDAHQDLTSTCAKLKRARDTLTELHALITHFGGKCYEPKTACKLIEETLAISNMAPL